MKFHNKNNIFFHSIFLTIIILLTHGSLTRASPIKTIVILVMENRSFDHMLGWMKRLNPDIDGVNGSESNRVSLSEPDSPLILYNDTAHYVVDPDPGHSFQAIREQIFGLGQTGSEPARMNGFAQQAYDVNKSMDMARHVMNGYRPEMVPVYKSLVQEFAGFDRWFASVPSSTQPNRLFVHSATSGGATSNIPALLAKGYPQRTIFENLESGGIPFGIYYQNIPATLFYRNLRKLKYVTKFLPYGTFFKRHARAGKLPGYVVIEQRYTDTKSEPANDDHPSHDVYQGQLFVKEVYETLRASPQWNETLLLITYDEHGGFYDHVPTPASGIPSPDGIVGPEPFLFKFDRLGVRVPTIAVSPWIEKGTVVHKAKGPYPTSEYEHSSIAATVKKLFNLSSPFLTKRDAWAGTFEGIVQTRTEPRTDCPAQLPTPVKIRKSEADENRPMSEFQQELMHLAAVLKGDNMLSSYPESIAKGQTVKQGKEYMEEAVKRFFEAARLAKKLGVDDEQIVKMRPSLTSRPSKSDSQQQQHP
ncbi:non-specific phospholipase C2 [Spinacia oleracea]|uniref:Non-specific phospholipase C2 n=1 Tax=Spinacia oleracea TaxID=3562 RepID=A0ABM3RQT3_SPIOL|nr:non-specific phospholipase C2 [Spinacia oleracea]